MSTLRQLIQLVQNMGWRYIRFRVSHELMRRTGLLKRRFPVNPPAEVYSSIAEWQNLAPHFFFKNREGVQVPENTSPETLAAQILAMQQGNFEFFSATTYWLGTDYDWLTNPSNNYRYTLKHWTEIPDYSAETGDIKFVWEKSRFSFLYPIIRHDYHTGTDHGPWVLDEITSWIAANPINQGPNWRCSQEISLRVLNWLFALQYYRDNPALTEEKFQQIQHLIRWQMHHVYQNINFSRIAVRNNHAITETLALYLVGLLMPHLPDAAQWKKKGKRWFEEEIAYQIYPDGTFLQFSMNYHRVVVQLLTWAITLAHRNQEQFSEVVYERAKKSLRFLMTCQDAVSGQLPNYGANDGALFFPLTPTGYRDYRSQLNALHYTLYAAHYSDEQEEACWFGAIPARVPATQPISDGAYAFDNGGYYVIRDTGTLTFVRCGSHKDRPSQADNLHMDIWVNGENILRDAGSYKYNTDADLLRYFMGTESHNTVQVGNNDQMQKGTRFIWYYWTQALDAHLYERPDTFEFTGTIAAYQYLQADARHTRTVRKRKGQLHWEIEDAVLNLPGELALHQRWHPYQPEGFSLKLASDTPEKWHEQRYYSGFYGQKEPAAQVTFTAVGRPITTTIILEKTL